MSSAPDAVLSTRFRADLIALIGADAVEHSRFGVALSGGPDSLALLLLAQSVLGSRVETATVNHGLRAEAADEAAWCAELCHDLGVTHATLTPPQPITGNIQSEARRARYALLDAWAKARKLDWLLTAHHADDQAETLLMRLNRGAGIGGLSGIRARNEKILRPLLTWRKTTLQEVVTEAGLTALYDSSNANTEFDRVRMRQDLARQDWINVAALARSANHLAEGEVALVWMTHMLADQHVQRNAEQQTIHIGAALATLPRELARRLILHALTLAEPDLTVRGEALDRLLLEMLARRQAMMGNLLITPDKADGGWTISVAPQRNTSSKDRI